MERIVHRKETEGDDLDDEHHSDRSTESVIGLRRNAGCCVCRSVRSRHANFEPLSGEPADTGPGRRLLCNNLANARCAEADWSIMHFVVPTGTSRGISRICPT